MNEIMFYNKSARIFIFFLALYFVAAGCHANKKEVTFAFMGDLHYNLNSPQTTDSLVQAVKAEINTLETQPEFLIQTGDFFHSGKDVNIEDEAELAFDHFSSIIGIPYYISKGNHDSKVHYEKNALPLFTKELEKDVRKSYYSFDKGNSHFIMLDCTEKNLDEMLLWLEKDLGSAKSDPEIEHIFAAGHYPLWIVARAGFTPAEYADSVSKLMAEYGVDAYFCGHTHNKTVTVRIIDGQPVTQIMDAAVVEKGRLNNLAPFLNHVAGQPADLSRPGILALEECHQIFIPEAELKYYHGYQEGSTTSYYIMTVNGKSVQADWYVLGQGLVHSFKWDEPGKLIDLKSPEKAIRQPIPENEMLEISKAWLYAALWIEKDSVSAPLEINGIPAGTFDISRRKMAASPFWNKVEILLDETVVKAIRKNNEISVGNPSDARFGLAHIFLLVQFNDGKFARTNIAPKVLTSFDPSGGTYPHFPAAELLDSVNEGEMLKKVSLNFGFYY